MFLDKHKTQAENEQDCFAYNLNLAIEQYHEGNFKKAAVYLENATRSAWELDSLSNHKKADDQAWLILKQIEGKRQQKELLHKMGSQYS
jgi:hypothetical protein